MFKKSLSHAIKGLLFAFRNERNFKIEVFIGSCVVLLSIVFQITFIEFLFICSAIFLSLITEIINSSIEHLSDIISKKYLNVIKVTKDLSAAGVLLSAIYSIIVGIIIFLPYIVLLIKGVL